MTRRVRVFAAIISVGVLFMARAQAEEKEPSAIVEIGGVGEWGLPGGVSGLGPSVAIEFTPIKDWLEIEAGTSTLFARGHTEWGTDLIFKKPLTLSVKAELHRARHLSRNGARR